MLTPYDETADFLPNHEMAISPIFRFLLQAECTFFKFCGLTTKNYGIHRMLPDGALKYAEKTFYDVLVAPVGITITLLSG
jgi:hypothetical protein